MINVKIKEQSLVAKLATRFMKWNSAAIVFGNTIHLWNIEKNELLHNRRLLYHEVEHVRQYNRYGFINFILLYLIESIKNGYYKNRFEVEARNAESKMPVTGEFNFL
jgi:hypothetical protein